MSTTSLSPFEFNVQLVNPDGTPTPYFIQWIQQFLEEKGIFEDAAVTLANLGGDPLKDGIVVWNEADQKFEFLVGASDGQLIFWDNVALRWRLGSSRCVSFPIVATPGVSELLMSWTPPLNEIAEFADDFAGSTGLTQNNPGGVYTMPVFKNAAHIGDINVSVAGVHTFVTSGAGVVSLTGGIDYLAVFGSAVADAAYKNATITFRRTK